MKRMFTGLLLLFAIGILACSPQTPNTNTPNVNASPQPSPKIGNGTNNDGDFDEVQVIIIIADDADNNPQLISVTPEKADLTGGKRVQWYVDNQSQVPAGQNTTVDIGPFKGVTDPNNNKPFGPDLCANNFTLNMLKEGKQSREISEPEKFQDGERAYQYEVVLKGEDGSELSRFKKLPEIIVGGMVLKPEPSPSATPKPSPTPKQKKY